MARQLTRRHFIQTGATAFAGMVALGTLHFALRGGGAARWAYHLGLQGRLRVARHEVTVSGGAALPRPLVMAFASDLHAGATTHPLIFSQLVKEITRLQPDALLLGGDYVTDRAKYVEVLVDLLAQCAPPLGKYAVLGNHDLWSDPARRHIPQRLADAGVQVLVNRNVALPAPFDQVSICGIDDPWFGAADVPRAFDGAGPGRIFLTHSPEGLRHARGTRFDVALAGHTHGGQVAYPDGTPVFHSGGRLSRRYNRGRFEIEGNGPLIVGRGVGCSILPIRLNADPELILLTLRAADPAA
jgi:predicted MPP superfamily phosphohydrolase